MGSKEYKGPSKKRLYLQHPEPDTYLTRRRITRVIPPPCKESPPNPPPPCPIIVEPVPAPCPTPPPPPALPALPPPEPPIEVIAVDVEPSDHSCKSSRSRSRSHRRSTDHDREVYVERERFVPVPVPVPVRVEPRYDTYRYVEAPRRLEHVPPRRRLVEDERDRITVSIDDHYRTREQRDR
ncbi:hypothetical protein DCS_07514 [Drechmeria coniospora]|uniref:Uncharacterized protein n=1 Tax=Drechmeria coniospora TaxID=98403 RepID=A0A151GEQ7_DRECN|nr:hypothetical protein DCS_07514 [Drechmeria coniospora]KYK55551.1 hypothetical protein DCS_07514 [Drechmeria coniospora]ODA81840.1 hypothetical protein RJ55_00345 [Drechmeria coniospora]